MENRGLFSQAERNVNKMESIQEIKKRVSELNELREALGVSGHAAIGPDPYAAFIGKAVGIRTVTFSQVGRLVEVHADALVLEDAACIFDWGRFAGGAAGDVSEVEPYPPGRVIVGRGSIVDCFLFGGKVPLKQK